MAYILLPRGVWQIRILGILLFIKTYKSFRQLEYIWKLLFVYVVFVYQSN